MTATDAYLRLRSGALTTHSKVPQVPGALVFVDVDAPTVGRPSIADLTWITKLLVSAPPGFFLQAGHVLLRWPASIADGALGEFASQAAAISRFISSRCARTIPVGIVRFPLGDDPEVVWSSAAVADGPDERRLLARARAAELGYLLSDGNGIWQPTTYHYRLPSGEHSDTFVRVANAFRRPRDATALATWLHGHVVDGLALVTDSPTLLSLVLGLQQAMVAAGYQLGPVVSLSDYPANVFEVEQAVASVQGAPLVLGLLSVTSTGSTSHRMAEAFRQVQVSHVLETLVNRVAPPASELPLKASAEPRPAWFGVGGEVHSYPTGDQCRLCQPTGSFWPLSDLRTSQAPPGPERARIVYIDPSSFEPMIASRPDLLTPAVRRATDARSLWELYDAVDGVGVHARPAETTIELRSNRPRLAIRCFPHWLLEASRYTGDGLSYPDFLSLVEQRVLKARELMQLRESTSDVDEAHRFDPERCDLVVTTEADADVDGFEDFLLAVSAGLGRPEAWSADRVVRVKPPYRTLAEDTRAIFEEANSVLVLTLGALTGTTMQQLLVAVHDELARRSVTGEPELSVGGLVLHARPEDLREWSVLHNAFTRLEALWLTPLPLSSPLEAERDLLQLVPESLSTSPFVAARREFLGGVDPRWEQRIVDSSVDPYALFWGMPLAGQPGSWLGQTKPRLRPGSRFGDRVRVTTTFAAVGAAMHWARLDARPKTAPVWQLFEMPAILRSYFDPPIIAAILRWLEPHEAWWGEREDDSSNVLAEALARATDDDRKLLLPELLLAAALGKIPQRGKEWLRVEASHVLWNVERSQPLEEDSEPWSEDEAEPVRVGLGLLGGPLTGSELSVAVRAAAQRLNDEVAKALDPLTAEDELLRRSRTLATAQVLELLESCLVLLASDSDETDADVPK